MKTESNSSHFRLSVRVSVLSATLFFFITAAPAMQAQGKITVEISTANYSGPAPGTRVDVGPYSVTTDGRGLGSLEITPGAHKIKVTGQCDVTQVMVSGNIGKDEYVTTSSFTFRVPQIGVYALHFLLNCGQRAETSPAGANGPGSTAGGDGAFVRPSKSLFAPGERIDVDYGNSKSSGWDWVVISQPGREKEARGSHTGISSDFSFKLEPNDNSIKDRRGTANFPALPKGKYVAKYVSWPNGHAELATIEFTVGDVPSAGTVPPASSGKPPANAASGDLSGLWRNPGGNATYRFRQLGQQLHWGVDAVPMGSFANVFKGDIRGTSIEGSWVDLPGSPTIGGGQLSLRIESDCKIVKTGEVNHYGAEVWVRKDSMCDVVGLTQRSNPSGTKPATGAKDKQAAIAKPKPAGTQPKVEEIPDNRGRVSTAKAPTTNKPNKPPVLEEIPESAVTNTASNKPRNQPPVLEEIPETAVTKTVSTKPRNQPPVLEEIPESAVTNTASNKPRNQPPVLEEIPETNNNPPATNRRGGKPTNSSGASEPKPKKEKKPRDPNKPDIWTLLGGAVREAITGQPNPGQTQPAPQAPAQTSSCQVGPYALVALNQPRTSEHVWMRFIAPAGRGAGSGDWVGVFRAGETQSTNDRLVSWMYLNSPDCVERFNLPPGQFDAYVFDASSFRATGNRSPISAGVRLVVHQ